MKKIVRGIISAKNIFQEKYKEKGIKNDCSCQVPTYSGFKVGDISISNELYYILPENVTITGGGDYDPHYDVDNDAICGGYRFYILEKPNESVTIDELDMSQTMLAMGSAKGDIPWAYACYSAATCGTGEWNLGIFGGHNVFDELSNYDGKYVIIEFDIG